MGCSPDQCILTAGESDCQNIKTQQGGFPHSFCVDAEICSVFVLFLISQQKFEPFEMLMKKFSWTPPTENSLSLKGNYHRGRDDVSCCLVLSVLKPDLLVQQFLLFYYYYSASFCASGYIPPSLERGKFVFKCSLWSLQKNVWLFWSPFWHEMWMVWYSGISNSLYFWYGNKLFLKVLIQFVCSW